MSGIAHPPVSISPRARIGRTAVLAALVTFAAIVAIVLAFALSGSSSNSPSLVTPSPARVSGPSEAARGQSAATSAGAQRVQTSGGPDESLRGRLSATSTSSGPLFATGGGPDESIRGNVAASSSRP